MDKESEEGVVALHPLISIAWIATMLIFCLMVFSSERDHAVEQPKMETCK